MVPFFLVVNHRIWRYQRDIYLIYCWVDWTMSYHLDDTLRRKATYIFFERKSEIKIVWSEKPDMYYWEERQDKMRWDDREEIRCHFFRDITYWEWSRAPFLPCQYKISHENESLSRFSSDFIPPFFSIKYIPKIYLTFLLDVSYVFTVFTMYHILSHRNLWS